MPLSLFSRGQTHGRVTEKEKFTMTLPAATVEWLAETYPDGLDTQDRLRMAVSDARLVRGTEYIRMMDGDGNGAGAGTTDC